MTENFSHDLSDPDVARDYQLDAQADADAIGAQVLADSLLDKGASRLNELIRQNNATHTVAEATLILQIGQPPIVRTAKDGTQADHRARMIDATLASHGAASCRGCGTPVTEAGRYCRGCITDPWPIGRD